MAEGLNRVMLLGNLGQDPELRYTQGGQAVLNLRLATTETYLDRDKNRRERTDWHNVVIWGRRGEALSKFLRKGSSIFVEGSIRTSSFEGRDGQKRWKTEVNARNVVLTGGGGGSGRRDEEGSPEAYDQRPAYDPGPPPAYDGGGSSGGSGGSGNPSAGEPAGGGPSDGGFGPDDDDDIPF